MNITYGKKDTYKTSVMAFLITGVFGLLLYFHVYLKTGIIFTHFFYIPVVLAAFWWQRRGILVAAGLGVLIVVSSLLFLHGDLANNVVRALMFVMVGFVVSLLSEVIGQKEEELKKSETLYRTLFENIGDGVAIYKAVNNGDDFVFVDLNSAAEAIDAIPRDEAIGRSILDIFPNIRQFGLFDVFRRVWMTGQSESLSVSHYEDERIQGWRENFVSKLQSGEIVAVYRDESERRRAEEKIQHLNAVLRAVRNVNKLITKENNPDELIHGACENLVETRGYSSAWVVLTDESGRPVKSAESGVGDTFSAMLENLREGELITCVNCTLQHPGIIILDDPLNQCADCPLSSHYGTKGVMAVRLEHGGIVYGVLCVSIPKHFTEDEEEQSLFEEVADDIAFALHSIEMETERKVMEEALHRRTYDLEQSNQDLEKFAYVASHDLQEPLRMVSSYVQLLSRRYREKLDSDADEFIGYAVDGAKRMQILINDLLSYSRIGTRGNSFQVTNSEEALGCALVNLRSLVEESGTIVTHEDLPMIMADKTQLGQVFQNLIHNAIKFRGDDTPRVHVVAEKNSDEWIFSVRDNGIGIDPKYCDRIFEIFQRLHGRNEYAGTGIGLAVCKKIVERHGGRIWVDSEADTGSIFYFTMPTVDDIGYVTV